MIEEIIHNSTHLTPQIISYIIKPYLEHASFSSFEIGKYDLTYRLDDPTHININQCIMGCLAHRGIGTLKYILETQSLNYDTIYTCMTASACRQDWVEIVERILQYYPNMWKNVFPSLIYDMITNSPNIIKFLIETEYEYSQQFLTEEIQINSSRLLIFL